jgi:hypothetical protein
MSNIQHSTSSDIWYTPVDIIERSRKVLGNIDLDPASSKLANRIVKANKFWTKIDNSLSFDWSEQVEDKVSVFLNPPSSGKLEGNKSWAGTYWHLLMNFKRKGKLKHAIFLGFSLEQLAITQNYDLECMCDFPACIPKKRTKFINPFGEANCPTHSNIISYIPGSIDNTLIFQEVFSDLGCIINVK